MNDRVEALDGLRAASVLGVILSGSGFVAPFGWIGVLVFYVLSGFLITRILVGERAQASGTGEYFGRFHFRRILRIFPLYFAYLFALDVVYLATSVHPTWPEVRPFAFGYAINAGMVLGAVDTRAGYGHLWTLAVEEQFYVLWPVVVWVLPRASLRRFVVALLALGPVLRLISAEWFGLSKGQIYVSSFSHVDAFAFGAALAVFELRRVRRVLPWAAAACGVALAAGLAVVFTSGAAVRTLGYREGLTDGSFTYVWGYSLLDGVAALVILAAVRGELPWLGHPVLAYLGKISYGIYLFQRPAIGLYREWIEPALAPLVPPAVALALGIALCTSGAVALAAASHRLFEGPLLRWRDRRVPARAVRLATEPG